MSRQNIFANSVHASSHLANDITKTQPTHDMFATTSRPTPQAEASLTNAKTERQFCVTDYRHEQQSLGGESMIKPPLVAGTIIVGTVIFQEVKVISSPGSKCTKTQI